MVLRLLRLAFAVSMLLSSDGRARQAPVAKRVATWTVHVVNEHVVAPGAVLRALLITGQRGRGSSSESLAWSVITLTLNAQACWGLRPLLQAEVWESQPSVRELLQKYAATASGQTVVGGVNGDFLEGEPNGIVVPAGLTVQDGRVLAGAWNRTHHNWPKQTDWAWKSLAVDNGGSYQIAEFLASGQVIAGARTIALTAWNRYDAAGITYFDSVWSGRRLPVRSANKHTVVPLTLTSSAAITLAPLTSLEQPLALGSAALVLGDELSDSERRALLNVLRPGQPLRIETRLRPFHPVQAVGGYPELVADGIEVPHLDSIHGTSRFVHDSLRRTAVGITKDGASIILAVVDGGEGLKTPGMTIPEVATLMRVLGAFRALNLDGSWSTALAVADSGARGEFRLETVDSTHSTSLALAAVRDCSQQRAREGR